MRIFIKLDPQVRLSQLLSIISIFQGTIEHSLSSRFESRLTIADTSFTIKKHEVDVLFCLGHAHSILLAVHGININLRLEQLVPLSSTSAVSTFRLSPPRSPWCHDV